MCDVQRQENDDDEVTFSEENEEEAIRGPVTDPGENRLYYLGHPNQPELFSGYGLAIWPDSRSLLVGALMIDRPRPADPDWLAEIEATFGPYQLVPMTSRGERGLLCQMQIRPDSLAHLRHIPGPQTKALQEALRPLLRRLPTPLLALWWDPETGCWRSQMAPSAELPPVLRALFRRQGYGCLPVEANIGVVHVCHAPDKDIAGFAGHPVSTQWQLIEMPTAPVIRLQILIYDQRDNPFRLESFLNIAAADQAEILARLAGQDHLYLAFYDDRLRYRYTKVVPHSQEQWQQLDELVAAAWRHWHTIPAGRRDFDQARAAFMAQVM